MPMKIQQMTPPFLPEAGSLVKLREDGSTKRPPILYGVVIWDAAGFKKYAAEFVENTKDIDRVDNSNPTPDMEKFFRRPLLVISNFAYVDKDGQTHMYVEFLSESRTWATYNIFLEPWI